MVSDIFYFTGYGLINPIMAIFINSYIPGGSIFAAGLASTLFFVTKCAVQLPFSRYVDSHDDKVRWLLVGAFFVALVPFLYIFARNVYWIYAAQVLQGLGSGVAYPTWVGLWSTHLDKKKESFEWSLYSTSVSLGMGLTALAGAAVAEFIGFRYTFALVGMLAFFGWLVLFGLEKERKGNLRVLPYLHRKKTSVQV